MSKKLHSKHKMSRAKKHTSSIKEARSKRQAQAKEHEGKSVGALTDEFAGRLGRAAEDRYLLKGKRAGRNQDKNATSNVAVITCALVRAGARLMFKYCPTEQLKDAAQSLAMQIAIVLQELAPEGEGPNEKVPLEHESPEAANDGPKILMSDKVHQKVKTEQDKPE